MNNPSVKFNEIEKMKMIKLITSDEVDRMRKIRLVKNDKVPIKGQSWKTSTSHCKKINMEHYNAGIPTGETNNLLVIDVDVKKEGKQSRMELQSSGGSR